MRIARPLPLVLVPLLAVTAACSDGSTARGANDARSQTTVAAARTSTTPSSSPGDPGAGGDPEARDAKSPCERLASALPFEGDWAPSFADPADEARGYGNAAPLGDVNYDRHLECGVSIRGGRAFVSAAANRIVDPTEWETTYAFRTSDGGCHAREMTRPSAKGYVCPPDARTSSTVGIIGVNGWVYEVEFAGFDGSTDEIDRAVGPVANPDAPNDALATEAVEAWITIVGDPSSYDLAGTESLPTPTTAPTPTARG